MSNRRAHRRWRASRVRHESRWGRRAGTVQRRPRPVAGKPRSEATTAVAPIVYTAAEIKAAMMAFFDAWADGGAL
jgi:hypothetical protein